MLKAFTYCDSSEEIAACLGLGMATLKRQVRSLYRKLRVGSRAFAVGRALRLGILTVHDLVPPPDGGEGPPAPDLGRH